jgi:hypothetical protein
MKTRLIFFVLAIGLIPLVLTTSCSKIKELTAVPVTYQLPRTNFLYTPSKVKSGEEILYSAFVRINIDSLLSAYGLSSGAVENPAFTQFSISIDLPAEANFGWMTSVRAIVSDNASFVPEVPMGSAVNNGGTGRTVILTVNNSNIPFGNNGFYIQILATLNGAVPYQWIGMYFIGTLKLTLQPI